MLPLVFEELETVYIFFVPFFLFHGQLVKSQLYQKSGGQPDIDQT